MSVRVIRRYDGPHRCEGMLVELSTAEWLDQNLIELLGTKQERALWDVEYLVTIAGREAADPIMLFHLRRTG